MQVDLNTIQTWANKWQVIFNPLKSESMLVSLRSNKGNGQNFTFQNHAINKVDTHKQLGLTWNSDASRKSYMSTIFSKPSKRIDMLRSLNFKLDRTSLEKSIFHILDLFSNMQVLYGILHPVMTISLQLLKTCKYQLLE